MPLLLDYLTVYGPMLEIIDSLMLRLDTCTEGQLCEQVFLQEASIESRREVLAYARQVGILNGVPSDIQPASVDRPLLRGRVDRTLPLELVLLQHFHTCTEPNHVHRDLYTFLLRVMDFDSLVLQRDEVWPSYNKFSSLDRNVINSPRMASWLRIYTFIGMVSPERSNIFTLTPSVKLVRLLVRQLRTQGAQLVVNGQVRLTDLVAYIEDGFCPMTDRRGRVHRGWVDALSALVVLGEIELSVIGDAPTITMGIHVYSHMSFLNALETPERDVQ